ncbi:MAG: carboxy terminal-processing peptidase, partial [Pirellulales bacterium]|nr:carboxy terminal-processing peptidase [Pirellulales bacterium]
NALAVEGVLHATFLRDFALAEDAGVKAEKTATCFSYTNYLVATAQGEPVEVAVASVLPCFWIYWEVGRHIQTRAGPSNPYERWINTYLKSLDPRKMYFLQSDVDQFYKQKHQLDDMIKRGNIRFAYDVYSLYLQRLVERKADINELIDIEHDFMVDELLNTDFENRDYPKDAAEARELWRKQVKYDFLLQKAADTEIEAARKKLHRRYDTFVENRKQMDGDELLETYLNALTSSYDPHTSYMSPTTLENFVISMRLQLEGIGAALQLLDGHTVISKVIPGGAADKDGRLQPEDNIIGVGQGVDGEIEDVVGMRLNDVVKQIRGKKGTVVRLQVTPGGKGEPKIYDITRAQIELKDSAAQSEIIETGNKPSGSVYRVGVIDLPSFYMDMEAARLGNENFRSTTRDVRRLLDEFRQTNVDVVMLDLRRNGGGSLTEAINLTGLFIDQGPIVRVKGADGNVQSYDDTDVGVSWSKPLVVLTSKFSASASEIFAGAIQDYRRGLVVGDYATHGKGTVQTLQNVGQRLFRIQKPPQLGALKVTMQQFYRPNGDSTQNRGVLADIELPSVTTHLDVGESDLDHSVAFDQVDAAPFEKLALVDNAMLDRLRKRSEDRCKNSEDFKKVEKTIAKYLEQKDRKSVSLKEDVFMADRGDAEEDALKEALEEDDDDAIEVPSLHRVDEFA